MILRTLAVFLGLSVFIAPAYADEGVDVGGNTKVWVGQNRPVPRQKSGTTEYWVEENAATDYIGKLTGKTVTYNPTLKSSEKG